MQYTIICRYIWWRYVQTMTFEQAEKWHYNPFDLTKVWPHKDFPLRQVGKLIFNRNPKNYFAEVEQLAFSPAHMVPGIEPSPDKMLQVTLSIQLFYNIKTYHNNGQLCNIHFLLSNIFLIKGTVVFIQWYPSSSTWCQFSADSCELPLQVQNNFK